MKKSNKYVYLRGKVSKQSLGRTPGVLFWICKLILLVQAEYNKSVEWLSPKCKVTIQTANVGMNKQHENDLNTNLRSQNCKLWWAKPEPLTRWWGRELRTKPHLTHRRQRLVERGETDKTQKARLAAHTDSSPLLPESVTSTVKQRGVKELEILLPVYDRIV